MLSKYGYMNVPILTKFHMNKEALRLLLSQASRFSQPSRPGSLCPLSTSYILYWDLCLCHGCASFLSISQKTKFRNVPCLIPPLLLLHLLILRPCPHPELDTSRILQCVVSILLREASPVVPRECISSLKDKQVSAISISEFDISDHQPLKGQNLEELGKGWTLNPMTLLPSVIGPSLL